MGGALGVGTASLRPCKLTRGGPAGEGPLNRSSPSVRRGKGVTAVAVLFLDAPSAGGYARSYGRGDAHSFRYRGRRPAGLRAAAAAGLRRIAAAGRPENGAG